MIDIARCKIPFELLPIYYFFIQKILKVYLGIMTCSEIFNLVMHDIN